jgi:hypothetical protein
MARGHTKLAGAAATAADTEAALRIVRLVALACAALMLVVIAASAYLRLSQVPALCGASSLCEGGAHATLAASVARGAHRVAAGAVPVLLVALLLVARGQRPRLTGQAWLAATALVIAVGLAVLGVRLGAATGPASPWVIVANLGGGFLLLALAAASWSGASARLPRAFVPRGLLPSSVLCMALVVALGGIASGGVDAARTAHRVGGALALVLMAFVAGRALLSSHEQPLASKALLVLAAVTAVLGAAVAFGPALLAVILLHNLAAALLCALLAAALARVISARG